MCLNLINSQYRSISEVEYLLENGFNMTEEKILKMKDNRAKIEKALDLAEFLEEQRSFGL